MLNNLNFAVQELSMKHLFVYAKVMPHNINRKTS